MERDGIQFHWKRGNDEIQRAVRILTLTLPFLFLGMLEAQLDAQGKRRPKDVKELRGARPKIMSCGDLLKKGCNMHCCWGNIVPGCEQY